MHPEEQENEPVEYDLHAPSATSNCAHGAPHEALVVVVPVVVPVVEVLVDVLPTPLYIVATPCTSPADSVRFRDQSRYDRSESPFAADMMGLFRVDGSAAAIGVVHDGVEVVASEAGSALHDVQVRTEGRLEVVVVHRDVLIAVGPLMFVHEANGMSELVHHGVVGDAIGSQVDGLTTSAATDGGEATGRGVLKRHVVGLVGARYETHSRLRRVSVPLADPSQNHVPSRKVCG